MPKPGRGSNICERCGGSGYTGWPPDRKPCPQCGGKGWYSYTIDVDKPEQDESPMESSTQTALGVEP